MNAMKTTITLSLSRIADVVFAHSAAISLDTSSPRPAVLNRSHSGMLGVMADNEIGRLLIELSGIVTEIDSESDSDLRTIGLEVPATAPLGAWRRSLENAVCCGVLAKVWADGPGAVYAADREALLASFRSLYARALPGSLQQSA